MREKYYSLSLFQVFAAICIVLRHYTYFMGGQGEIASYLGRMNFVEFFFCCSGFFVFRASLFKGRIGSGFMVGRLAKLYPLHFLTTCFFLLVLCLRYTGAYTPVSGNSYSFSDAPYVLALLHSFFVTDGNVFNYPSWYLSAQFFMYILFIPAFFALRKWTDTAARVGLGLVVLSVVLAELISAGSSRHWTDRTYDFGALRAIPSFFSGVLIGFYFDRLRRFRLGWGWGLALVACCFVAFSVDQAPVLTYFLLQIALVPVLALAELSYGRMREFRIGGIELGELSFGIYMLHVPVATVLLSFIARRMGGEAWMPVWIMVAVSVSIFASWVWCRYFSEKSSTLFSLLCIRLWGHGRVVR